MEMENIINQQLESLDMEALQELMGVSEENICGQSMSLKELLYAMINGEPVFSWDDIKQSILDIFLVEIQATMGFVVEILIVCIAVGMLKNLSSSFEGESVSKLGNLIISCVITAMCLQNLIMVYGIAEDTLTNMCRLMEILLALMIPLIFVTGGITSGGLIQTAMMGAMTIFTVFLSKMIFPASFLSGIFVLANSFTNKPYIQKAAGFLRNFAVTMMGLIVTLLSGMSALQSMASASADTVLMKTARFSIDNFIPIIGGFASDSVDLIMSCTQVIKNGIGIFGLFILLGMLATPLIKLAVIGVIYKIAGILTEPIADKQISSCFTELGSCIVTMTVILLLCAILFLVFISILITAGSGAS